MKIISHRGNLNGKSNYENNPKQIQAVLKMGLDCEIDLWLYEGYFFLGHDEPTHKIKRSFLQQKGLWIHCKNLAALENVPSKTNYFWHENDDFTLTSKNFIWTFPGKNVGKNSVIVDNNPNWQINKYNCYGVCSDFVLK